MKRVPEPELMDDPAQAQAYADADFSEPNTLFYENFAASCDPVDFGGYILDLGCGPGDIAVRLARAYRRCRVHGVDGSAAMLRIARARVFDALLAERISLFQCTIPQITVPRSRYDAVISNSLLHHLANPCTLWEAIKCLATPGAPVLVMDLMRPPSHRQVDTLVRTYAADAATVLRRDFRRSLLAAYTTDEVIGQLAVCKLDYLRVRVVSDRHFTVGGCFRG